MAVPLNALKKAIVLGPDGTSLLNTHANVVSSDANVVAVQLTGNGEFFAAWASSRHRDPDRHPPR